MRIYAQLKLVVVATAISLLALHVAAQESEKAVVNNAVTNNAAATKTATAKSNSASSAAATPDANKTPTNKKMVQDATISLQTTITGNQEQPKVLYILPWQSPQTANVDFEPLDNQQKAVFNHVERDELRRELETADAIED